jgi:hypothetical protein
MQGMRKHGWWMVMLAVLLVGSAQAQPLPDEPTEVSADQALVGTFLFASDPEKLGGVPGEVLVNVDGVVRSFSFTQDDETLISELKNLAVGDQVRLTEEREEEESRLTSLEFKAPRITCTVTGELTFISKNHRGFRIQPDSKKQTFGLAHGETGDIEKQLPGLAKGDKVRVTYSPDDRCREQVRSVEKLESAP